MWARHVEGELLEVRATLAHFLEAGNMLDGLRMATGAGRFWLNQGHMAEGRQWLSAFRGRGRVRGTPVRERALALVWSARLEMDELVSGETSASSPVLARLQQARALARSIQDEQLELETLVFLTGILTPDDDLERGLSLADEGIARARHVNRWRLAELLHTGALLAHRAGHRERAAELAADACALADELGNERLSIEARLTLSFTAPGTTRAELTPTLAELVPVAQALGDQRVLAWLSPAVGSEALSSGRVADAAHWFQISMAIARDSGYWHAGAFGMMGTQAVAFVRQQWESAARLFGVLWPQVARLRRGAPPAHLRSWEAMVGATRAAMGEVSFDAAAREGSHLSWDAALNEAMAICQAEGRSPDRPDASQRPRSAAPRSWNLDLTERELDVLRLIATGGTNKDVASALGISAKTVMHHSVAIYRKLGVRGRAEATAVAYRTNLLEASAPT